MSEDHMTCLASRFVFVLKAELDATIRAPVATSVETWQYTRSVDAQGVPLRTVVQTRGLGDLVASSTTTAYPDDAVVPADLRGRAVSETEAGAVATRRTPTIGTNRYGYAYDSIGNRRWASANAVTNVYAANCLNQYTSILCDSASPREPTYDADGNVIDQIGTYAGQFFFGFSTKYHDREIDMISYQRRFYRPELGRWLTRDPIQEDGGYNLYTFCGNNPDSIFDLLGLTVVRLNMSVEPQADGLNEREFMKIEVTVLKPPEEGWRLNFIQFKKDWGGQWELDYKKTVGPYYYSYSEVAKFQSKNKDGQMTISLFDAPRGQLNVVQFLTFAIEHNLCCNKVGFVFRCVDRIRILEGRYWRFLPNSREHYDYETSSRGRSMTSSMRNLITKSLWRSVFSPNTRMEFVK